LKHLHEYARFISPRHRARRSVGGKIVGLLASLGAIVTAVQFFPSARRYLRMKRM